MKNKIVAILCAVTLSLGLSTECLASVAELNSGAEENYLSENQVIREDELPIEELSVEEAQGIETLQESYTEPIEKKYRFKDLNKLSNEEIIKLAEEISWKDIPDIFQYNEDTVEFYSNSNRVQAIIDGLYEKACTFTATEDKGIDTLVEILRSGFYLGFYNEPLNYLKDRSFHDKCIPALIAMENNPNFKLGEEGQDKVVLAFGKLIGNASCNPEVVNKSVVILDQYYNDIMDKFPKDKLKGDAVLKIMSEVTYDINQYCYDNEIRDGKNTPWTGNIDTFIDKVSKFAAMEKITEDNGWLINNGIYYTAKLAKYHSNPRLPHEVIDKCIKVLPNTSEQYFNALDLLKNEFESKDSKGNVVDVDKLFEKEKDRLLPKTYTFDDGKMIIKAGDKVSESKIQRLYWASKEVKAQFHRVVENDKPLEAGNADDVLTMVIYNSPAEYKMNRLLYGYSVDNGGIYIEGIGTFFTYERTPAESIYSLEELFRHEYTHYLQGRYLVPGLFNQGDFYLGNNSRLTWFEEGSAEFFAGSTRTTVLPRKSMLGGISQSQEDRLTANKLFHSSYSDGWGFYNYGYTFSDYMYNGNRDLFKSLVDSMKANNVEDYENIIENSSKDSNVDAGYQKHMDKLLENYDGYGIPLVADDYMKRQDKKGLNEIKADIDGAMGLTDSKIVKEKSQYFDTYTLKGNYKLNYNNGDIENWNLMNEKINQAIESLTNLSWGGYKTVTGYFVNPRVNSNNEVEYEVVFHGLFNHNKNFNEEPLANMECVKKANTGDEISFSSEGSTDDGDIVSYEWDFGDGQISNEKNPVYAYRIPGDYTVKLTVTDDRGLKAEKYAEIAISKVLKGKEVFEKEENNTFESANAINLNELVKGNLQQGDTQDVFEFQVTKADDITITLENNIEDEKGFNWLLFNAEDTSQYIAYPEHKMDQLTRTVTTDKPGKYYLVVYQNFDEKTDYKFVIEGTEEVIGIIPDDNDNKITTVTEEEYNDNYDTANGIFKNQIMNGKLDSSDRQDTYYFNAQSAGTINVTLENGNSESTVVNWLAFDSEDTSNYIGYASLQEGNKFSGSFEVTKPGKYYIVAYEVEGKCADYSIKIDGDIEKAITSGEVIEDKDDNTFQGANKINVNSTVKDSLNGEDNTDIYCFNINETKDLSIDLRSLDKLGIAWQLFNENDLNNYMAYGYKSGDSVIGNVQVKSGKYYVYVYKYSYDDGNYELTIK